MAGKIRAQDIAEIKSRINIADIVGEYVSLKRASVGSLKGLCPFHDEKSPSFNVNQVQGFYHCFGCGEGGDVYKFLENIEKISFYDAVERLAARISFQITYEAGGTAPEQGARNRILEANRMAAEFYQSQLMSDEASSGRDFLKGRGFDKAAAEQFAIGYAPKGWSALTDHLKSKGFSIEELVSAGLASQSDKGGYDKFRGRLIWPIRDAASAVIGFGARKLYDDDNGPKYLNTSDTVVYHKSQVLYGIDLAKKDIGKKHQVVVVEGYTDVMACHLAGITTAVASCGTAFGDDHIRILNRMLGDGKDVPAEVIFTFDPDAAGQKAAMRAFADAHKFNAQTYVAVGPEGLDPCDLRSAKGDEAVVQMITDKRPMFEFAIKTKLAPFDLSALENRVAAARAASSVISQIGDTALRSAYTRELATMVSLDVSEVARVVEEAIKLNRNETISKLRLEPVALPEQPVNAHGALPEVNLNDPQNRIDRMVLEVLLQVTDGYTANQFTRIARAGMAAPAHQAILSYLLQSVEAGLNIEQLVSNAPENLAVALRTIVTKPLPATDEESLKKYASGVINKAIENVLQREKQDLLAELRRTDSGTQRYRLIQQGIVDIDREIHSNKEH
ncbi:MAG: DNA primase [Micrococcales bacterium]